MTSEGFLKFLSGLHSQPWSLVDSIRQVESLDREWNG
jgi:hypothetical protein